MSGKPPIVRVCSKKVLDMISSICEQSCNEVQERQSAMLQDIIAIARRSLPTLLQDALGVGALVLMLVAALHLPVF